MSVTALSLPVICCAMQMFVFIRLFSILGSSHSTSLHNQSLSNATPTQASWKTKHRTVDSYVYLWHRKLVSSNDSEQMGLDRFIIEGFGLEGA